MIARSRRSVKALLRQKCERTLRALNRDDERALLDEVCCLAEACEQIREALNEKFDLHETGAGPATISEEVRLYEFGEHVKDTITGFSGTVTGRCEYLTGCNQVLVQPEVGEKGEFREGRWFDDDRLERTGGPKKELTRHEHNGPDIPAPVR